MAPLDTTNTTGHVTGFQAYWNTVGANSPNLNGARFQLNAGYTGSGITRVIDVQNLVAGSQPLGIADVGGNIGASIESQGNAATGDNVGVYAVANGSQNVNIAVYGRSIEQNTGVTSSSIANIGVVGLGAHHPGHGSQTAIGGFFTPSASTSWYTQIADQTTSSTALLLDNSTESVPLLIGRINGVNAFQITSIGGILNQPSADSTGLWQVKNHAGATFFDLDSINQRVGVGTASPLGLLHLSGPSATGNSIFLENTSGTSRRNAIVFRGSGTSQFALINDLNSTNDKNFSIRDSIANAVRLYIDSTGDVQIAGSAADTTPAMFVGHNGNLGIGTTTEFGSGAGVIGIANATTDPTTPPAGGGVLYVSGGALKYRGSSGAITTIAAA